MGAGDRIVALHVTLLRRHPHVDPGAPRALAVALDGPREPDLVRRVDPDPNRVRRAKRPVESADAFHDDHALGCHDARATLLAGGPVVR